MPTLSICYCEIFPKSVTCKVCNNCNHILIYDNRLISECMYCDTRILCSHMDSFLVIVDGIYKVYLCAKCKFCISAIHGTTYCFYNGDLLYIIIDKII